MKKRIAALFLSAMMVFQTSGLAAFAEGGQTQSETSTCVCVDVENKGHTKTCSLYNEQGNQDSPECTCEAAEGEAHKEGCPLYAAPECDCGTETGVHGENCPLYEKPDQDEEEKECTCEAAEGEAHKEGCPLYAAPECNCGTETGVHGENCPLYTEPAPAPAPVQETFTDDAKGVEVQVNAPEGAFEDPENTTVVITPVDYREKWKKDGKEFLGELFSAEDPVAVVEEAIERLTEVKPQNMAAYDITFVANGEEVQPSKPVNVTFSLAEDSVLVPEGETAELQVYHIDDSAVAETVGETQTVEAGGEVTVTADEFSIYVVGANSRTITAEKTVITVGETITLTSDKNSGGWSTDNEDVATISSKRGKTCNVTGVFPGTATISRGQDKSTITVKGEEGVVYVKVNYNGNRAEQSVGSGTTVTLTAENGQGYTAVTDANGVAKFEDVPVGTYTASASYDTIYSYTGSVTFSDNDPSETITLTRPKTYQHINIRKATAGSTGSAGTTIKAIEGNKVTVTTNGEAKDYTLSLQGQGGYEWSTGRDARENIYHNSVISFTAIMEDGSVYKVELDASDVYPENTYFKDNKEDYRELGEFYGIMETQNGYNISGKSIFEVANIVCGNSTVNGKGNISGGGLDFVLSISDIINNAENVIRGTKTVDGEAPVNKAFTFKRTEAEVNPNGTWTLKDGTSKTVSSDPNTGVFAFAADTYNQAGTYYYVVEEVAGAEQNMVYDTTKYHVTVNVTKRTTGSGSNNTVTSYEASVEKIEKVKEGAVNEEVRSITFNNTYNVTTSASFTKVWNGTPTSFVVKLKDSNTPANTVDVTVTVNGDTATAAVTGGYTAAVTKTDAKNWSITVNGLPAGSNYAVDSETSVGGENTKNENGVITTKESANDTDWWQAAISGNTVTNTHYTVERNDPKGTLKIKKTGENSAVLQGAAFTLYSDYACETVVAFKTTGSDGIATFDNLAAGTYYLKETAAPSGYVTPETMWTVTVTKTTDNTGVMADDTDGGKKITYTDTVTVKVGNTEVPVGGFAITNTKIKGKIKIAKSVNVPAASETSYTFKVTQNSVEKASLTVNEGNNWTATTGDLPAGTYTITEVTPSASGNYKWDDVVFSGTGVTDGDKSATVTINSNGQIIEVTARNDYSIKTDGSLKVTKTVNGEGAPTNASFTFTVKLGNSEENRTGLAYVGDGVYTFDLKHGENKTITGIPYNTSYTVSEANYSTHYTTTNTGSLSGTINSNNKNVTVAYTNTYFEGGFTIHKVDESEDRITTAEATFVLYKGNSTSDSDKYDTYTTGTTGIVTISGLPAGTYTLKETNPPTGYSLGTVTEWTVEVTSTATTVTEKQNLIQKLFRRTGNNLLNNGVLTVENQRQKGALTISKAVSSDDGKLTTANLPAGTEFKFTVSGYSGDVVLNAANNWTQTLTNLPTGNYTVTETTPTDIGNYDYTKTTHKINSGNEVVGVTASSVSVTNGGTATVAFTNTYTRKVGGLKVTKSVDNKGVTPPTDAPTTFYIKVQDEAGKVVKKTSSDNGIYAITAGGTVMYSNLPTGKYTVTEVNQDGTAINTATFPYTVTGDGEVTVSKGSNPATVNITNTLKVGKLTVEKVVDGDLTKATVPSGKTFTFQVKKGSTLIETVTLPTQAGDWSKELTLPYGEYTVVETDDADIADYDRVTTYLDSDAAMGTVTAGTDGKVNINSNTTQTVTVTNTYTRQTGSLTINKTFVDENGTAIEPVNSVKVSFTLKGENGEGAYTVEVTKDANGKWTATKAGLPTGTYTITEGVAPEIPGYTFASATYKGDITEGKVTIIKSNTAKEVNVTNRYTAKPTASYTFTKKGQTVTTTVTRYYDEDGDFKYKTESTSTSGTYLLGGATFQLVRVDDDDSMGVAYATSDNEGKVTFTGLSEGKYIITEATAPTDYTEWLGKITVTVDDKLNVTASGDGVTIADGNIVVMNTAYREATHSVYDDDDDDDDKPKKDKPKKPGIVKEPLGDLPKTGSSHNAAAIGAAMMLTGICLLGSKKNKHK